MEDLPDEWKEKWQEMKEEYVKKDNDKMGEWTP